MTPNQPRGKRDAIKQWWQGTLDFVIEEWELVATATVALLFLLGGLIGLNEKGLTEATLGLLAALAIALAKERSARKDLGQKADDLVLATTQTNVAIEALQRPRPYFVQDYSGDWDLDASAGGTVVKKKTIHFEQDGVFAIPDWGRSDGTDTVRREFDDQEVESFETLHSPGTRRDYDLIFLGKFCNQGDIGIFVVTRVLENAFPDSSEYVTASIDEPTAVSRIRVRWPPTRPPSKVVFEMWKNSVRQSAEDVMSQVRTENGRTTFDRAMVRPDVGTLLRVTWSW